MNAELTCEVAGAKGTLATVILLIRIPVSCDEHLEASNADNKGPCDYTESVICRSRCKSDEGKMPLSKLSLSKAAHYILRYTEKTGRMSHISESPCKTLGSEPMASDL